MCHGNDTCWIHADAVGEAKACETSAERTVMGHAMANTAIREVRSQARPLHRELHAFMQSSS